MQRRKFLFSRDIGYLDMTVEGPNTLSQHNARD
jgi:hypothetical protein